MEKILKFSKKLSIKKVILLFLILGFLLFYREIKGQILNQEIIEDFLNSDNIQQINGLEVNEGNLKIKENETNFSENFNSYSDGSLPSNWTLYADDNNPEWQVYQHTLNYPNNSYNNAKAILNSIKIQNGEVTADIKFLGGEQLGSIIFRFQDSNNYYELIFSSLYDFIAFRKIINGNITTLANYSYDFQVDTFYTLKIVFSNSNLKGYFNNNQVLEVDDSSIISKGKIGFYRTGTGIMIDNIIINSYDNFFGYAESKTLTQTENIQSINLTSLSGENLDKNQVFIFVSNDNGKNWWRIIENRKILFPNEGKNFKYKIYLKHTQTSPIISKLAFRLNYGVKETLNLERHKDLTRLQYNIGSNAYINDSFDPNYLKLYHSIPKLKVVQQPAIVKNKKNEIIAYFPDTEKLVAYNLSKKEILWTRILNSFIESSPYIYNGVIYLGAYDKNFYAINQDNGEILWKYTTDNEISGGSVEIKGDKIYFVDYGYSGISKLYCLNLQTHQLIWFFSYPGTAFLTFTLDPDSDILYLIVPNKAYALGSEDGSVIWESNFNRGYVTKNPVVYSDKLIIGCDRGLVVLNRLTGEIIVDNPDNFTSTEEGIGASPVVFDNIVYYPTKSSHKLIARKLDSGELVWEKIINDPTGTFSSPVLTEDGYIYLAYNSGMRIFKKEDGEQVWMSSQRAWVENNPAIAHNYLIFTDPQGEGTIYIYNLNKETYQSKNGLKIFFNDQNIDTVYVNDYPAINFSCESNFFTISENGLITINYGISDERISKPKNMIISKINQDKIKVCYDGGKATFSYPINIDFNKVLKDGVELSKDYWSKVGKIVKITDSFSSHTYQFIKEEKINTKNENSTIDEYLNCNYPSPGNKAPWIFGAISESSSSITLYFTDGDDPLTHYALVYGLKPNSYQFGSLNIGQKGIGKFTIKNLLPNTGYFIRIIPINVCTPGIESNEIFAKTLIGGEKRSKENIFITSIKKKEKNNLEKKYSFKINQLRVKFVDQRNNPISDLKVSLLPDGKKGKTNKEGIVVFKNLENKNYKISIGEKEFDLFFDKNKSYDDYFVTFKILNSNNNKNQKKNFLEYLFDFIVSQIKNFSFRKSY